MKIKLQACLQVVHERLGLRHGRLREFNLSREFFLEMDWQTACNPAPLEDLVYGNAGTPNKVVHPISIPIDYLHMQPETEAIGCLAW
jgi:hypothetical protein